MTWRRKDRESPNVEAAAHLAREEQEEATVRVGGVRMLADDVPSRAELRDEERRS